MSARGKRGGISRRPLAGPKALTGSANWTMNALAAQTNNALIIMNNAEAAALYQACWDQLEKDTD